MFVGAGWAVARLPWKRRSLQRLQQRDRLLQWLVMDGFGFHEAYFHPRRTVVGQMVPKWLNGYARQVFDQGVGRCLWFVDGAIPERIAASIGSFASSRRADLWAGIGLGCAYAGGVDGKAYELLGQLGEGFRSHLAQGAAFAAKTRQLAGNPSAHTQRACEILCGVSADEAAGVTDEALEGLPTQQAKPEYEIWRTRIRHRLSNERQS